MSASLAASVWFATGAGAASVRPGPLLNALRTAVSDTHAPGAQAAIVVCGRGLWSGADGVLDERSERPVRGNTLFPIASSTKMVTATMVMQRVQAAKLSLDAPLAQYYPRLPNARNASKITVRMLLQNRSGLRDYGEDLPGLKKHYNAEKREWQRDWILNALEGTKTLFSPDKKYKYTNANWIVLGGILEKVTPGTSIQSYFEQKIAARNRARMPLSTWERRPGMWRLMAHPYLDNGTTEWLPRFGPPTSYFGQTFTDGGLVSTATELARFGNALFEGKLVSPATLAQMTAVRPSEPGEAYGLGVLRKKFEGRFWFGHDGSYQGYESQNYTDRTRHVTIAVTSNMENTAELIWEDVVRAYDEQAPHGPTTCPR